jgi:hypothetical protein
VCSLSSAKEKSWLIAIDSVDQNKSIDLSPKTLMFCIERTVCSRFAEIASGCAAARLTQFHNFAQEGAAYVKASQAVLDEDGNAAIEAYSLIGQKGRDGLRTPDDRGEFIVGENQELRKRLLLLRDTSDAMRAAGTVLRDARDAGGSASSLDTGDGSAKRIRFHWKAESSNQGRQFGRRQNPRSYP